MSEVYFDTEFIPGQAEWIKDYVSKGVKPPANYKKQETIDTWYVEKFDDAVQDALDKTAFNGAMNELICICVALGDDSARKFYDDTEENILSEFFCFLENDADPYGSVFVGHNIVNCDLRIIKQRAIVHGIKPPECLVRAFNSKPWDRSPFDIMHQWDGKDYTKLDLIAKALGLDGKNDIDGSMVYGLWRAGNFDQIADYCADEVENMIRPIYKRMSLVL